MLADDIVIVSFRVEKHLKLVNRRVLLSPLKGVSTFERIKRLSILHVSRKFHEVPERRGPLCLTHPTVPATNSSGCSLADCTQRPRWHSQHKTLGNPPVRMSRRFTFAHSVPRLWIFSSSVSVRLHTPTALRCSIYTYRRKNLSERASAAEF